MLSILFYIWALGGVIVLILAATNVIDMPIKVMLCIGFATIINAMLAIKEGDKNR